MRIIADLHIHSRFSRATSPKLTPPYLDRWARVKGIELLGTGDCTHPLWLKTLHDELDEAEPGFYTLKKEIRAAFDSGPALLEGLPNLPETAVRFVLTGEISTIYKHGDKTRKIHHLVILPDFRAAAAFQVKLEQVGNIRSDGRPILGIDSRDLLALLLDTDERSLLIPAHIWTPWFSALGAKSGFDSIQECYRDLADRIPAVETGLSSNPPMNWALESLDGFSIISNSDAHSPDKIGREATFFEMDWNFPSFRDAFFSTEFHSEENPSTRIKKNGILGTVEFFPQEGKYHYDGHRSCGVYLAPEEALERGGICPVCGKAFTPGVMGRVLELADRPVDERAPCPVRGGPNCRPYFSLIPLGEIMSEVLGAGPASKKVMVPYTRLIEKAGSEFSILLDLPRDEIVTGCKSFFPGDDLAENLGEAITRMRQGEVFITPGYDGEYGVIRTFAQDEPKKISAGLFAEPEFRAGKTRKTPKAAAIPRVKKNAGKNKSRDPASEPPARPFILDSRQQTLVDSRAKECLIIAGPGTGKTAVLAAKIAALIREGAEPASVLALSFTIRAAGELRDRVLRLIRERSGLENGPAPRAPLVSTFHSFCAAVLREYYQAAALPPDFRILGETERKEILEKIGKTPGPKSRGIHSSGNYIEERKRFLLLPGENAKDLYRILPFPLHSLVASLVPEKIFHTEGASISPQEITYAQYREYLRGQGLVDYDGLVAGTARLLALRDDIRESVRQKYLHILVDEYQDLNFAQYVLIRLLVPSGRESPSLWVIGDPNQAIYGFRGSDKVFIDRFEEDYPKARRFELRKSFRCGAPIIEAAGRLTNTSLEGADTPAGEVNLSRRGFATEKSEAEGIARAIAALVGGTSFFALDSGAAGEGPEDFNLESCAVLVRAFALAEPVIKALKNHGIPFELPETARWWENDPVRTVLAILEERCRTGFKSGGPCSGFSMEDEIFDAWKSAGISEKSRSPARKKTAVLETPEPVLELVSLAKLFGSVQALLDGLSAGQDAEAPGSRLIPGPVSQGVKIMTIHASKGLEFDYVFVPALEEGLLPFTLYDEDRSGAGDRLSEERRLLYVAMTRARRGLWLSSAASRFFQGRVLKALPSRFLDELGNLVPLVEEERRFKRDTQISLF